jgi:hypothetical protein
MHQRFFLTNEAVFAPASRLVRQLIVAFSRSGFLRRYVAATLLYSTFLLAHPLACAQGLVIPAAPDAAGNMHLGTVGEISISDLDEMETRLQFATVEQAANLLVRLGVEPGAAREAAEQSRQERRIRLEAEPADRRYAPPPLERAVLFLPDIGQGNAEIILLERRHKGASASPWRGMDHQFINQFAHDASYEWLVLEGAPRPLLAVHHVNSGHGSNIAQDQTVLYRVRGGKLVECLRTQDFINKQQWKEHAPVDDPQELEQTSTFLPFPDGSLEQTQSSTVDGRLSRVERRSWRWNAEQGRFVTGAFKIAGTR